MHLFNAFHMKNNSCVVFNSTNFCKNFLIVFCYSYLLTFS